MVMAIVTLPGYYRPLHLTSILIMFDYVTECGEMDTISIEFHLITYNIAAHLD